MLTKGCAGDVVAAATSKKASQSVVVKDFEPSEVLSAHRPCLAAVEQDRPNQGLINSTLGIERNLSLGPHNIFQDGKGAARKTPPSVDFVLSLTSCCTGRAVLFVIVNLLQCNTTRTDLFRVPGRVALDFYPLIRSPNTSSKRSALCFSVGNISLFFY